ncbi:MAG TPA: tetratricopeptide repeat protein [Thermoanaerobaculia bacterium]|nr:tetratricopeptide repeat protein [Thermoanaerobaculia bacterium]
MEQLLFGFFSLGIFSVLPLVISVVAVVDAFRVGAPCYWIWIIFAFPIVGVAAYFFVVRRGSVRIPISMDAARRVQARRRLRELQIQLNHWRGPAILAEAGEQQLVLGRHQEAEKHFREAGENGADVEDVNFGLAQALQMQRRFAEAVPLLEELVKRKPDACMGRAQLQLGRSLDESGEKERAEEVLRDLLQRRPIIEAQVRLARLLLARGEKEEARRLLAEVKSDAAGLPRYLRRQHRSWIWTARALRSGDSRLPRPYVEGGPRPGHRLRMGLTAAGAAAVIVLVVLYGSWELRMQAKAFAEGAAAEAAADSAEETDLAAERQ